jgi:hypothetical protein
MMWSGSGFGFGLSTCCFTFIGNAEREKAREGLEKGKPKLVCDIENECRIKPRFSEKFRPGDVQKIIEETMREVLSEKTFDDTLAQEWVNEIVSRVNDRVVEIGFPRYKTITQVIILEVRRSTIYQ